MTAKYEVTAEHVLWRGTDAELRGIFEAVLGHPVKDDAWAGFLKDRADAEHDRVLKRGGKPV